MENPAKLSPLKNTETFVTRFAPAGTGWMHIGHLKALLINHLYTKMYKGKMVLRFDDTDPENENKLYEDAILNDTKTLGIKFDQITYASDYFPRITGLAIMLINKNLAYVDFSTPEEVNQMRSKLKPSPYRDSDPSINLIHFKQMTTGEITGCCLRAKIDYKSKNGCMRDPVMFRCKNIPHPRCGSTYRVYPTYDFSCPMLDAMQGITHAMRSNEYHDRDDQYKWFLEKLDMMEGPYPMISDYGKLNFAYAVLSKRKLAKLVDAKLVEGWDDPRMPTIQGVLRRGIRVEPLISYIQTQVNSHAIVTLAWEKLWSFNLKYLDDITPRIYGIGPNVRQIKLVGNLPESVDLPNHPKNKDFGSRKITLTEDIIVDPLDFGMLDLDKRYTLVGLGNAIMVSTNPPTLKYDPNDTDFKSTIKITWLPDKNNIKVMVKKFGHLLSKPKLEENDDIINVFNKNSVDVSTWLLEESIKSVPVGGIVQVMRKDYCYVDQNNDSGIIIHIVPHP